MEIRTAGMEDLPDILAIYEKARKFQVQTGNPNQWAGGYPQEAVVCKDIENGNCMLCMQEDTIAGVFAFFTGEDPTYIRIYDGKWLNDREYGTIHRIAGNGTVKGMAGFCFQWALAKCKGNLKIDTHEDNKVMQHVLEKNGFVYCGTIITDDGTTRMAYQKTE